MIFFEDHFNGKKNNALKFIPFINFALI